MDTLPELLFSEAARGTESRRVRRLADAGRLRRLYAGIYTSNLDAPLESIVQRHWLSIVGHLLPGGVISHRSAFDASPIDGQLVITRGRTRRAVALPGLRIEVIAGPKPKAGTGTARDMPIGALFLASEPRRFLENFVRGRGWSTRILTQPELEAQLERILTIRGERSLNDLRDSARSLAARAPQWRKPYERLNGIVGALLGTHAKRKLASKQALARAAGRPYDVDRITLFDNLFAALGKAILAPHPDPAPRGAALENFAFFEAYFSNYIEGTTFTVAEAESIVFDGRIVANRSADTHDVLGTFAAASRAPWRNAPARTADEFLAWLKNVNALIMQRRPDTLPGQWKERINQAGSTLFVLPELVPGTLREGFKRIGALADPVARALMTMFVVAEVHPFVDGNGRTARIAMNAVLSAAKQCRIIVPTVFREDYLMPLKALSNHRETEPYIRAMARVHTWTAALDWSASRPALRDALMRIHAFEDDPQRFKLVFPEAKRKGSGR